MNEKLASAKKFVANHKVAIAVTATATTTTAVCVGLFRSALVQHDDFLRENDLYDTYYSLTTED